MKKLLFIGCLLFASYSYSQKVDTVKNSLQINPVLVNPLKGDTAYQITWSVNVFRGKGEDCLSYIKFLDRHGNKVQDVNIIIPSSVIEVWLDDKVIDDFILNRFKLSKRK